MLTYRNVEIPKCWNTEMSKYQIVNIPKCQNTEMSKWRNVKMVKFKMPKCQKGEIQNAKMSKWQNVINFLNFAAIVHHVHLLDKKHSLSLYIYCSLSLSVSRSLIMYSRSHPPTHSLDYIPYEGSHKKTAKLRTLSEPTESPLRNYGHFILKFIIFFLLELKMREVNILYTIVFTHEVRTPMRGPVGWMWLHKQKQHSCIRTDLLNA